jgi:hypothetical protein
MTGENAGLRGCHLRLAMQACGCYGCGCAGVGAGVGQRGGGRYIYTATLKNQENRVVNHRGLLSQSHTQCFVKHTQEALQVVEATHPSTVLNKCSAGCLNDATLRSMKQPLPQLRLELSSVLYNYHY